MIRCLTGNNGLKTSNLPSIIVKMEVLPLKSRQRPIGLFDSGLGGISVLGDAMRLLPYEDFIYYGDSGHAPYGDKRPEEVLELSKAAVDKLLGLGCKAFVVACNTATSVAAHALREDLEQPVIGMEPALKPASLMPGNGSVLVMATQMTLALPKFAGLMEHYGQDAIPIACPGLVERVEAGELTGRRVEGLIGEFLAPYRNRPIKAIVLGCTHFVFLRDAITGVVGPGVTLVDGNQGTARQLMRKLMEADLLNVQTQKKGQVTFLTSAHKEREALERMQEMLQRSMQQAGI